MTATEQPTLFHIVFTEDERDPARETKWHRTLREAFPKGRKPKFYVQADMTQEEFEAMTGRSDVETHIGHILEHSDGPGVFGIQEALMEVTRLTDTITMIDNTLEPVDTEDLDAAGWEALVHVMVETLDMDWDVQRDMVTPEFVRLHRERISRFMQPRDDLDD